MLGIFEVGGSKGSASSHFVIVLVTPPITTKTLITFQLLLLHTSISKMSSDDPTALKTPPSCTADFCLIPIGTPTASVSKEVAEVQRLLKKSGLNYSMHSAGTTLGMSSLSYPLPLPRLHILLRMRFVGARKVLR